MKRNVTVSLITGLVAFLASSPIWADHFRPLSPNHTSYGEVSLGQRWQSDDDSSDDGSDDSSDDDSGDVPCAVETQRQLGSRLRNHL